MRNHSEPMRVASAARALKSRNSSVRNPAGISECRASVTDPKLNPKTIRYTSVDIVKSSALRQVRGAAKSDILRGGCRAICEVVNRIHADEPFVMEPRSTAQDTRFAARWALGIGCGQ